MGRQAWAKVVGGEREVEKLVPRGLSKTNAQGCRGLSGLWNDQCRHRGIALSELMNAARVSNTP